MRAYEKVLRGLLSAGAVYFLAVAVAHMTGIKVPLLFVYYNVPSYAYQDRIIAFLAFGWSLFLFAASRDPLGNRFAVKAVLVAGIAAVAGLTVINEVTDFRALAPAADPAVYHAETSGLAVYAVALMYSYFIASRQAGRSD